MQYSPLSNLNNDYYLKFRHDLLNGYFKNIKLDELDIKQVCDELQIKYSNYTDNFYNMYNNLFLEYKILNSLT